MRWACFVVFCRGFIVIGYFRETLNKYLRDAQGTRGTKQLKRWCDENPSVTVLPLKMCKLLYVIVRLLQNARFVLPFVGKA